VPGDAARNLEGLSCSAPSHAAPDQRIRSADLQLVHRTPRISCEAVPPFILPAGAQGGTSACRTGAALSFVSCIRLFGDVMFSAMSVVGSCAKRCAHP
jgi:hypothetical protein